MDDGPVGPDLSHPDAMIRIASAVHRFPCPEIVEGGKVSFVGSFRTAGQHETTRALMRNADRARGHLAENLVKTHGAGATGSAPQEAVVASANAYLPLIHSVLTSCKVQGEHAQLDKRLIFKWAGGFERGAATDAKKIKRRTHESEVIMFELVMVVASLALGTAGAACDDSVDGNFAAASQGFKRAAAVLKCLADDQLPQWISRGTAVDTNTDLPAECSVAVCDAFSTFFLAAAQQMAVATVLVKPGVPNYSLLAKLTLGVSESMESFVSTIRSGASTYMARVDEGFFALVTYQINLHRALSLYFSARAVWDGPDDEYGVAIAVLSEAAKALRTRESAVSSGLPDVSARKSSLRALEKDTLEVRKHVRALLSSWESDNSKVYFTRVPTTVPENRLLSKGLLMMKIDPPYTLEDADLVHLGPVARTGADDDAGSGGGTSCDDDEALARELQEKLNRGDMD